MTRFSHLPAGYEEDQRRKADGDFSFTVPGELPTLNELINLSKTHWSKYKEAKDSAEARVEFYAQQAGVPFFKSCEIEFIYYRKNRTFDPDNISAGARKIILDSLENIGCIKNDGWKEIKGFKESWKVDKENPRTFIKLKEVKDG